MAAEATAEKATKKSGLKSTPEGAAAAREARDQAAAKDVFRYLGEPKVKVAPQAGAIINTVKALDKKGKGVTRKDLVDALSAKDDKGVAVLVTRQPAGRILSYYQKLISSDEVGAVAIDKGSTKAE